MRAVSRPRLVVPALAVLLLGLLAALPATYARPVARPEPAAAASVSGARAHQDVEALAGQLGSRPVGSPHYDQAVQYALDQLRQAGYQPYLQTFPVETYDDRGSQVMLLPGGEALAASTLQYSPAG